MKNIMKCWPNKGKTPKWK